MCDILLFSHFHFQITSLYSGDLNIDSLIQLHQMFLKKCHTQCLLGSRGNDAYRTIHLALKMILQFCSIYQDYQRTTDDESLQKLTQFWLHSH